MFIRLRSDLYALAQLFVVISLVSSPLYGGERIASTIAGTGRVYPQALLPLACSNTSAPVYLEMAAPAAFSQAHPCAPLMPMILGQTDGGTSGTVGKNLKFIIPTRDDVGIVVTYTSEGSVDKSMITAPLTNKKFFIVDEGASPLLAYISRELYLEVQLFKDKEATSALTNPFQLNSKLKFEGTAAAITFCNLQRSLQEAFTIALCKQDNIQKLYLKAKIVVPEIEIGLNDTEKKYLPYKKIPSNRTLDVQNVITLQISEKK